MSGPLSGEIGAGYKLLLKNNVKGPLFEDASRIKCVQERCYVWSTPFKIHFHGRDSPCPPLKS